MPGFLTFRSLRRGLRAAVAGLAFVALVPMSAEAAHNFIAGQVVDRNGQPVDRAIITLSPGNVQLITDNQGKYLIDYLRDDAGARTKLTKKVDYDLEVFKPGFHLEKRKFFYKSGPITIDTITLKEETLRVEDDNQNLDPGLFKSTTQSTGATYEGQ